MANKLFKVNQPARGFIKPVLACMALAAIGGILVYNGIESRKYGFDIYPFGLYFFAGLSLVLIARMIFAPRPAHRKSVRSAKLRQWYG